MKKFPFYLWAALLGATPLQAINNEALFNKSNYQEPKIVVNNRILARINGKPITTYDLMKKMDLTFYRQFPQYASSIEARFQYYQMGWLYTLEEMIDKELILADAQESKIDVSSGDVRQEMEDSFGPNIIANLDKIGLSFDEAAKIVREEIIIQRMIAGRVHAKALRSVTPSMVREAYATFSQDPSNARLTNWEYRIVTIKERTFEKTEETGKQVYQMLMDGVSLDQLVDQVKEKKLLGRKGKVTVSEVIKNNEKELSPAYQEELAGLDAGMYSQPFMVKSRALNANVSRILYVQEKIPGGLPTFKEVEGMLKEQLLGQAVERETQEYLRKLRQHYHIIPGEIESQLPPDYQPFILK